MTSTLISRSNTLPPQHQGCPSCHHPHLTPFYKVPHVPIFSTLLLSSQTEALNFPTGDVELAFCENCGFITNLAFDPKLGKISLNYEDQQGFSPTFSQFADQISTHLIQQYDLHNRTILEIGCGKGDFLALLCEKGNNQGIGIDPIARPDRIPAHLTDRITFLSESFAAERHAHHLGDLVCCRHTLEHIDRPAEFLQSVRAAIGNRCHPAVFFELPDTARILRQAAFEDIYYEHCSYFTPGSLARLFRRCGFVMTTLYLAYADQYLMLEARPISPTGIEPTGIEPTAIEESAQQTANWVQQFTLQIQTKLDRWRQHLYQAKQQGKRIVVWGSGSKCVSFLTTLGSPDQVEYIVDINPHRQGQFIPGLGKEVMSPEFLRDYHPDQVIVMNPIYCQEIQEMLDRLEVKAEIIGLD